MEKFYGIFMNNGEHRTYGELSGSGLVKMHFSDFSSEEAAVQFINTSSKIPSNVEFYILAFSKYKKPTPSA